MNSETISNFISGKQLTEEEIKFVRVEFQRYLKSFSSIFFESSKFAKMLEKSSQEKYFDKDQWLLGFHAGRNYQMAVDSAALSQIINQSALQLNRPIANLVITNSKVPVPEWKYPNDVSDVVNVSDLAVVANKLEDQGYEVLIKYEEVENESI